MGLTAGPYGATVTRALGNIFRVQSKRMRLLQPALTVLDILRSEERTEDKPADKGSDRVGPVLRASSSERTDPGSVPTPPAAERERKPASHPVSKPKSEAIATLHAWERERAPVSHPASKAKSQAVVHPRATEPERKPASEPVSKPESEAIVTSQAAEPERKPVFEPVSKPNSQAAAFAPQAMPMGETAPGIERTERAHKPQPASEVAPNQAPSPSQLSDASEDRFTAPAEAPLSPQNADYYEILQISLNADPETIHRVYRIMAGRFHPDNPTTGNLERFLLLREAYRTLSDPAMRADYDATHQRCQLETLPIFWQKSFVDGIEGEANRRLGILSLLYHRRRVDHSKPGISVMELEQRMAFPREYLNFALWYLRSKGYISMMEDNSDYALTAAGVDYVETSSAKNKVIRELLAPGTGADDKPAKGPARKVRKVSSRAPRQSRSAATLRVCAESGAANYVTAASGSSSF